MDQNIMQKAAFLKGLAEGMELDTDKKEGKLILALIDLVDELASKVNAIEEATIEIEDELDEIAEELLEIETTIDECHGDCDCDCDDCDCDDYDDDFDYDCDGECFYYTVVCPTCNNVINLDESLAKEGGMICPNCGEELEFEYEDEDCGCNCDCDCDCE